MIEIDVYLICDRCGGHYFTGELNGHAAREKAKTWGWLIEDKDYCRVCAEVVERERGTYKGAKNDLEMRNGC